MPSNIAEQLRPLARPIDSLTLLPGNPRRGDIDAVARSYERFGQRKPIVARADGTVIAGNHQLQAAQRLGWDEIAVVVVDDDDLTAKAYALADNRTSELGDYDDTALMTLLDEVAVDADLLAAASFSVYDMNALLSTAPHEAEIGLGDPVDIAERYQVVVECASESEQEALLLRLATEGLNVKAIIV